MQRLNFFLALLIAFAGARLASANVVIEVFASPAPNFFSSPSWAAYSANASNSLENGLGNIGDRTSDPTAYEIIADGSIINAREFIVTPFDSWRGEASPASPFDSEQGNRIHFGAHIVGDGTMKFRLEDLTFISESTDFLNVFNSTFNFSGIPYDPERVGINYGPDGIKGTGDDVIIDSGPATQLIDEFIYVGVGTGFEAASVPGLDAVFNYASTQQPFDFSGGYVLTDTFGTEIASNSVTLVVVPEPTTFMLFGSAGLIIGSRRKKRMLI
ncbi:MAG: PEP-CTERM sorting domain-containing protein [Planctomycetota bacterium]